MSLMYCHSLLVCLWLFFFFKQKTAYEMRISDWSSDVCSSDLNGRDIDVRVGFSGSYRHQYELTVSMVDEAGANIETLHRNEYSLGASTGELHILVRQAQVAAAAEALALKPPYRSRVPPALVEPSRPPVRQFGSLPRQLRQSRTAPRH